MSQVIQNTDTSDITVIISSQMKSEGSLKPVSSPEEEVLFFEGDLFFERVCEAISGAQAQIHFQSYIFNQDQLGTRILKLLREAASRGVRVQLLLDGVGASQWNAEAIEKVRASGIELRIYHPLPWQKSHRKFWKWWRIRVLLRGLYKLNRRNHRKIYVMDEKIAFVGSMNVSDHHLTSVAGPFAWRDVSLQLRGPMIHFFSRICTRTWNNTAHVRKTLSEEKNADYERLLRSIRGARQKIWITNPYFVPDRKVKKALTLAATRGVDVRLLVQGKTDFFGVKYAMQSYYTALLKSGVKVFEYLPSILHAKVLIVDDEVTIGSSNFDHRSLFLDLEVNAPIQLPSNKELIERNFLEGLSFCQEVILQEWKKRPLHQKILEKLFYYCRGVL